MLITMVARFEESCDHPMGYVLQDGVLKYTGNMEDNYELNEVFPGLTCDVVDGGIDPETGEALDIDVEVYVVFPDTGGLKMWKGAIHECMNRPFDFMESPTI